MKRLLITLIALCSLVTAGAQRQRYNFNSDWNITFADPDTNPSSEAKKVTLPHAWNEDYAFMVEIRQHPDAEVWYR